MIANRSDRKIQWTPCSERIAVIITYVNWRLVRELSGSGAM